jgi:predicted nucleotidyltransferase
VNPFLKAIDALNNSGARYVIVGGLAGYLHGTRRITVDLDLILDLRSQESLRAIDALLSAGFQSRLPVDPHQFADPLIRTGWIRDKNMVVFSLFHPELQGFIVDLFVDEPIPFESLYERSTELNFDGSKARVCAIDDLIDLKLKADRDKDRADVIMLRELKSMKEPGHP